MLLSEMLISVTVSIIQFLGFIVYKIREFFHGVKKEKTDLNG